MAGFYHKNNLIQFDWVFHLYYSFKDRFDGWLKKFWVSSLSELLGPDVNRERVQLPNGSSFAASINIGRNVKRAVFKTWVNSRKWTILVPDQTLEEGILVSRQRGASTEEDLIFAREVSINFFLSCACKVTLKRSPFLHLWTY